VERTHLSASELPPEKELQVSNEKVLNLFVCDDPVLRIHQSTHYNRGSMQPARIAEILEPFLRPAATSGHCHSESGQRPGEEPAVLSPQQLQQISTYIDILQRWNARMNLTAIRDEEEIVTRHFGESLFAAQHLFPKSARGTADAPLRLADIGSGAGFPGIPIKLWAPEVHVTLIESNQKKATFLREVARALTLTNIDIQNARAESLAGQTFDTVTFRAVERFDSVLPIAANLLSHGGRLVLLIGSAQLDQAQAALPNLTWSERIPVPLSRNRVLAIGTTGDTRS
jgi:16S rRNA (guanine527-N7)-methyltransferase